MKYYIDAKEIFPEPGAVRFVHSAGNEIVICGSCISPLFSDIENSGNISFINDYGEFKTTLYGMPYLDIFAYDDGGVFCTINEQYDGEELQKIYYIDKKSCRVYEQGRGIRNFLISVTDGKFTKNLICPKKKSLFSALFPRLKNTLKFQKYRNFFQKINSLKQAVYSSAFLSAA